MTLMDSDSGTQNVFPHRPDYERPDRPDDYQPRKPMAAAPTGLSGTAVEQAQAVFEHTVATHNRYLDQLEQDRHRYSDTGYAEQAALFGETAAAKAIDTAVEGVQARVDHAQKGVDDMRAGFIKPGDAAAESRALRFWNRTRAVLDSADSAGKFSEAEALLSKANRDELSVLLEELPSYLRLHLGPMDDKTKRRLDLPKSADWGDWIDTAYLPRAIPEYGKARARLAKANKALAVTQFSAESLRRSIAEGRPFGRPITSATNYDPDK